MITTPRLHLVRASEPLLTTLIANQPLLLDGAPVDVPAEWADLWIEHPGALAYTLDGIRNDPSLYALGWWGYLLIHRVDQRLVGMSGFKGKPNEVGVVEIGYSIVDPYRQQGLATEAARGLVQFAFDHPDVRRVMAHTLAFENPSNRLLKSIGFQYNGLINDPDDGEIWQWILDR